MKLTNQGPLDLDRVDVQPIPAHRAHEAAIEGIYDHRTGGTAPYEETGMLRRGESWTVEVIPARRVVDGQELDRAAPPGSAASAGPPGMSPGTASSRLTSPLLPSWGSCDTHCRVG